jgi:hypothetical protein
MIIEELARLTREGMPRLADVFAHMPKHAGWLGEHA